MKIKALISILQSLDGEDWVEYYVAANQRLHLTAAKLGDVIQRPIEASLNVTIGGVDF